MVVDDFNVIGVSVAPNETDTPLIVNPNTMLPFLVAAQRLQTVPGRRDQVTQFRRAIQLPQLATRDVLDRLKTPAAMAVMKPLCLRTPEQFNHQFMVYRTAFNVKR